MRLQRFFVSRMLDKEENSILALAALTNQIKNVFRLKRGDKVILFDNSGFDLIANIEGYSGEQTIFKIVKVIKHSRKPSKETFLFVSLVKKDKFEWIAEKATELGVSHIIPILSERSEKKSLNFERLQKIIIEAAEQSGRSILPVLHETTDLEKAILGYRKICSIAWHPPAQKFVSQDVERSHGAYIGPEGGWSPKELDLFAKYEIPLYSLGSQILKTETAVIAVVSRLVF